MPSRWFSLAIVAFWLLCMGWMFVSDILPGWRRQGPPPYTIDLVDEAKTSAKDRKRHIRWNVYLAGYKPKIEAQAARGAGNVGLFAPLSNYLLGQAALVAALDDLEWMRRVQFVARTYVEHNPQPDDSFIFNVEFDVVNARSEGIQLGRLKVKRMDSSYQVTREGQLLAMEANFLFDAWVLGVEVNNLKARLSGDVVNKEFHSSYHFQNLPVLGELRANLAPVKMSHNDSVMIPLQPVNRILGLKPGQTWAMPLINPLADALSATQGRGVHKDNPVLHARVLPELQQLPDTMVRVQCLVIEYDDEEVQPRTWVQESTGLVVRQEATVMPKFRLIMQRQILIADR